MDAAGIEPAIALRMASVRYGAATAVDSVSLAVRPGEFVVLLGPSGAGKSTVFRCLSGLVRPESGEARVLGQRVDRLGARALREVRRSIGLVFQQHNLIGRLRAIDNVLTGCLAEAPLWRVLARRFARKDRQLALACLDRVGLLEKAWQRADSLSGGQQQRVAIARVLAQRGRVLLADEPVASLDPESARQVLELLASVARQEGMAVLCSLHQVGLAREFADRLIGLRQGRVVFDLPAGDFREADEATLYLRPSADEPTHPLSVRFAPVCDQLSPT
ncbi:MAG: phosphonate ABC transporter ATP-binding protein [Betaproteobacteria bacterium]|nr:phosphonate ABC transporter ATP-binding protein [Betaproteobacteria bacterium]